MKKQGFGYNLSGYLGVGKDQNKIDLPMRSLLPNKVFIFHCGYNVNPIYPFLKLVPQILKKKKHSVALCEDECVYTCGTNEEGQSDITLSGRRNWSTWKKLNVSFEGRVKKISCGRCHTSAINRFIFFTKMLNIF